MAEPESPFLRPSPWGKLPQQGPMRIGPLPKAGAPLAPPPAAPRPASRANILAGSLIPTAAPTAPVATRVPDPPPIETPRVEPAAPPKDQVTLEEVVVTPFSNLKKQPSKPSAAPWVIGGTIAAVAALVGLVVLTGKDAGQAPAAAPSGPASTTRPAPEPAPVRAPTPIEAAPAAPAPKVAEARPQPRQARPQRTPQVSERRSTPTPAETAAKPITLNPTPIEPPPAAAPVELKPYTPPPPPDPEAPMTNQQPGR